MKLKGPGKSVQTLATSLDGGFKIVMGEGYVKTEALDLFTGGPTQVVTKMIAGDKKEYTVLNCDGSPTDITKGMASLTAAATDTEYAKITGKNFDRPSEALDMTINLKPKSAILSLAVVVKVNGTLDNPSCGLDELSILRELDGMVPGFGFSSAHLLDQGELCADGNNPCLAPAEAKGVSKRAPPQEEPSGPFARGVEGVGKLLKGFFVR